MERIAEAIYEACRVEAADSGRPVVPEVWAKREEAFRNQFVATIARICQPGYDTTPEREHDSWWQAYMDMGWQYGEVRDPVAKTHPDMVPYDQLSKAEREKDAVFLACCAVGRVAVELLEVVARLRKVEEAAKDLRDNAHEDPESNWYAVNAARMEELDEALEGGEA